jgi:hypothetical protein
MPSSFHSVKLSVDAINHHDGIFVALENKKFFFLLRESNSKVNSAEESPRK